MELVRPIMARTEQLAGLDDETVEARPDGRAHLGGGGAVGGDGDGVRRIAARPERHVADVDTADHRRIDQVFQRAGRELDERSFLLRDLERRAELPALRQPYPGTALQVTSGLAL